MKLRALLIVMAGLLVAADAKDDEIKKEMAKLEGSWKVVALEKSGKPAPDEVLKEAPRITFKGDRINLKFSGKDKEQESTYKLDPSKKPKEIDIVEKRGDRNEPSKSIYLLDGDDLKICMARPGLERPTEFATKEGAQHSMLTLKREKP